MDIEEILIVDDSPSARFVLGRLLERHGYKVVMVSSAEQALGLLELRQPDLVLMDHLMRGMNGLEATRQMRQSWKTTDVPVVLLTASDDPGFEERALAHGATAVLPKNSDPETVLGLLKKLEEGGPEALARSPEVPPAESAAEERREIETEVLLAEVSDRLRGRLEPVIADTLREVFEYCERQVREEAKRVLPRLRHDVEHAIRELTGNLMEEVLQERVRSPRTVRPRVGTLRREAGARAGGKPQAQGGKPS